MKKVLFILALALCMVGCEQKEAVMSVANKTFYHHETHSVSFEFTTDSAYYIRQEKVVYKGPYTQDEDLITITFGELSCLEYIIVKRDMIIWHGEIYTQIRPIN